MIDTHTHYFLNEFDSDRYTLLDKLKENGVSRVIEAAIDMESNFRMRKLFINNEMVSFGTGIHPLRAANAEKTYGMSCCKGIIRELIGSPRTVAVGETGLDFHRDNCDDEEKKLQRDYFKMQIELALEYDVPLILHIRGCHEEALEILESYGTRFKGAAHCFIGSADIAKRYIELGFYLGIGGSCTYSKNREGLGEFICDLHLLPLDNIVLETDAPYLIPTNGRGKKNSSLNLDVIAERLSGALNVPYDEVVRVTESNALKCFFEQ